MHPILRVFGVGLLAAVVAVLGVIVHGLLVGLLEAEPLAPLVAAVPLSADGLAVLALLVGAFALLVAVVGGRDIPLIDGGADVEGEDD